MALLHHNPGDAAASFRRGGQARGDAGAAPFLPDTTNAPCGERRGVRVSGRPMRSLRLAWPAVAFRQARPAPTRALQP